MRSRRGWFWGYYRVEKGSDTSGNYGHKGRKGKRGGSLPGGGHGAIGLGVDLSDTDRMKAIWQYRERRAQEAKAKKRGKLKEGPINLTSRGTPATEEHMDTKAEDFLTAQAGESWLDLAWDETGDQIQKAAQTLSMYTDFSEDQAYKALDKWAHTSNDNDMGALSMQQAASEVFGIPLSKFQQDRLPYAQKAVEAGLRDGPIADPATTRGFIKEMYRETQLQLQESGYKPGDTIRMYRGVMLNTSQYVQDGSVMDLEQNVMSSWTIAPTIADDFTGDISSGIVLGMNVPIENILSTAASGFGTLGEAEFVVLGVPGSQATVLYHGA